MSPHPPHNETGYLFVAVRVNSRIGQAASDRRSLDRTARMCYSYDRPLRSCSNVRSRLTYGWNTSVPFCSAVFLFKYELWDTASCSIFRQSVPPPR